MLFDDANVVNVYIKNNDSKKDEPALINADEGFIKGNMFKDEYIPYLNFKPQNLVPKTEKDALLLKLYETDFALHDLNLYLDLHPQDEKMYTAFKQYVNLYNNCKETYEKKYGPIDLESSIPEKYDWYKNPWPWDKDGGSMYV
jgi:hypothetical protein